MWRIIAIVVAGLTFSLAAAAAPPPRAAAADGKEDKKPAGDEVEKISIEQFEEKRKGEDVVVLDVRTPKEYEDAHVPGARNIDYQDEEFAKRVAALDKGKTYVLYCRSGRRSAEAAAKMKKLGFDKLFNFAGSMIEWERAEKSVEKGPEKTTE